MIGHRMTWSFRIGRFFGIDVFLHFTFLLMLVWIVGEAYYRTKDWWVAGDRLLFFILLFTIVVMHEYGHALTARLFGVKTKDIILLPIGGVARLESIPQKPWQEFLIAIAGPVVNVVLAMLCTIWMVVDGTFAAALQELMRPPAAGNALQSVLDSSMAVRLLGVNITLIVFNLIPAFPMDGGRVLRSVLAMGLDYVQATWIAARIGQAVAVVFAILGFWDPMMFLIAFFVWTGALQEAQFTAVRASLAGLTAQQAMSANFLTLNPFDTLETASQKLVMTPQLGFPVLHGDAFVGMISRNEISAALSNLGPGRHISEVMRREPPVARPTDLLLNLLPQLKQGAGALAVVEGDQLIGLLTLNDLAARMNQRPRS
jgi:Zn-dependent protease/predicted transcriptional regulator